MPKGVSGEEGIRPTGDSGGVRDLSKRVEAAPHVACLQMQPVEGEKAPPYLEQEDD